MRPERSLPTPEEIVAAAEWRLRDWGMPAVSQGVAVVSELLKRNCEISERWSEAADVMAGFDDGLDQWSALCSLLVLIAAATRNHELLYRAGIAVIEWRAQCSRRERGRRADALDLLIDEALATTQDITPAALWGEFVSRSEGEGFDAVIGEYDADRQEIFYSEGDQERPITFAAFRRRVQRAKKRLSVGATEPVVVAPHVPNLNAMEDRPMTEREFRSAYCKLLEQVWVASLAVEALAKRLDSPDAMLVSTMLGDIWVAAKEEMDLTAATTRPGELRIN